MSTAPLLRRAHRRGEGRSLVFIALGMLAAALVFAVVLGLVLVVGSLFFLGRSVDSTFEEVGRELELEGRLGALVVMPERAPLATWAGSHASCAVGRA